MTIKEEMRLIRQAEKAAAIPVINHEYKKGRRSNAEIYNGKIPLAEKVVKCFIPFNKLQTKAIF